MVSIYLLLGESHCTLSAADKKWMGNMVVTNKRRGPDAEILIHVWANTKPNITFFRLTSQLLNPLTPRVKPWVIQSLLIFDSIDITVKCDHSLESC